MKILTIILLILSIVAIISFLITIVYYFYPYIAKIIIKLNNLIIKILFPNVKTHNIIIPLIVMLVLGNCLTIVYADEWKSNYQPEEEQTIYYQFPDNINDFDINDFLNTLSNDFSSCKISYLWAKDGVLSKWERIPKPSLAFITNNQGDVISISGSEFYGSSSANYNGHMRLFLTKVEENKLFLKDRMDVYIADDFGVPVEDYQNQHLNDLEVFKSLQEYVHTEASLSWNITFGYSESLILDSGAYYLDSKGKLDYSESGLEIDGAYIMITCIDYRLEFQVHNSSLKEEPIALYIFK